MVVHSFLRKTSAENGFSSRRIKLFFHNTLNVSLIVLLLVLLIMAVSCSVIYSLSSKRLRTTAIQESQTTLDKNADVITKTFEARWAIMTYRSMMQAINSHLPDSRDSIPYVSLLMLHNELSSRFSPDDIFPDLLLYIHDDSHNYLCSTKYICDNLQRDYQNGLLYVEGLSYEDFLELISNESSNTFVRSGNYAGRYVVSYSRGYTDSETIFLPHKITAYTDSYDAVMILQMNLDALKEQMLSSQYAGDFFCLYQNGECLYTTDKTIEPVDIASEDIPDENGIYYLKTSIDDLNITAYISLDNDKIYTGIAPFRNLLRTFIVMTLFISLVVSISFLLYWFKPISDISKYIPSEEMDDKSLISAIGSHMKRLYEQNTVAEAAISEYRKKDLLNLMYHGKVLTAADIADISKMIPGKNDTFRCMCAGNLKGPEAYPLQLEPVICAMRQCDLPCLCENIVEGTFVCLIPIGETSPYLDSSEFFPRVNELLSLLNSTENLYAIGISNVYTGYRSIPTTYNEARNSLRSAVNWQNSAVVFNKGKSEYTNKYQISYLQLDSMYQAIMSSHEETALKIYDQIVENNFSHSNTHQRALFCRQFTNDILGVLVRVSTQYDIDDLLESEKLKVTDCPIKDRISQLRQAIQECCELVPVANDVDDLTDEIYQYCVKHYREYQLSLTTLADQFGLSESSMSKLFKSHFGVNFVTYIERLRIKNAERLILQNQLSVRAIATECGYQNITTFYNAFRRIHTCTPTEWRVQQNCLSHQESRNPASISAQSTESLP